MNGYGTIDRMYRPLAIGTIKRDDATVVDVIFTASAVQGGIDGYHRLVEGDKVVYRLFSDEIAGAKLAADVWKKTP
jgi:cold shock CspA family protein